MCNRDGCQQCEEGYYVNGKTCAKCSSAIVGCAACDDGMTCTKCKSEFLTVFENERTKKKECKCDGNSRRPFMIVRADGSCDCEEGYFLTEEGCRTCNEIIPGCDKCSKSSWQKTMFEIYSEAEVNTYSRQSYLSCSQCAYDRYKEFGNYN